MGQRLGVLLFDSIRFSIPISLKRRALGAWMGGIELEAQG